MSSSAVSSAITYARENQKRFLEELKDLLRIPSVSTTEEHKGDVRKAAEMVAADLKRIGFENVEIIPTSGHPLVYADWLHAAGKPTALCYAHFDVQPAEPLDEWHTPPWEPTERNNNIYARGAVDDKGQLWMQMKAYESLFKAGDGKLPINVRVLFEGEEEVGGEAIEEYVKKNAKNGKLKADFALVTDTELFAPDLPTLCVGLRGLVYTELEAQGAEDRSALGRLRRSRAQRDLRAGRNHQQAEGRRRQSPDSRLLRRRAEADRRRIEGMGASAV